MIEAGDMLPVGPPASLARELCQDIIYTAEARHTTIPEPGLQQQAAEMMPEGEAMLPDGLAAGPDLDLPYQAANDAFAVEEEIEIERYTV